MASEPGSVMTTRTGKTFRGRLNDYERDELLLQMMEKHEVDGEASGNKDAEGKQTVTGETEMQGAVNNGKEPRKEESQTRQQSNFLNWSRNFINRNHYDPRDTDEDTTKKVKIDVPDFDGRFDATNFIDWVSAIEEYFDWYDMTNERRVRFAKMKLVNLAKVWWNGVEADFRRMKQAPITTWQEMKAKLREKYMPPNYEDRLCVQLVNLRQGTMTVAEYMQKFDELKTRSQILEDARHSLARFKSGLRFEIRKEMLRYAPYSVENAFQIALDLEEYLNLSSTKKVLRKLVIK